MFQNSDVFDGKTKFDPIIEKDIFFYHAIITKKNFVSEIEINK